MDPPVCRLCGAKHWSQEPHALKEAVVDMVVDKPIVVVDKSRSADRHTGDRREYFRLQKRRRRGAGK